MIKWNKFVDLTNLIYFNPNQLFQLHFIGLVNIILDFVI